MVKGLVKFKTACTMIKKTKYVDASPSERVEGRLLPSDGRSLAGVDLWITSAGAAEIQHIIRS